MSEDRIRVVYSAVYFLAVALVVIPLFEGLSQIFPLSPTAVRWRYGLVGYIGNSLPLPLLGWVMAVVGSAFLGHRRVLKALSVLSLLLVVGIIVSLGFFFLDALELRGSVNPELKRAFDSASMKAALSFGLALLTLAWISWGGWKAAQSGLSTSGGREGKSGGGLVPAPSPGLKKEPSE